MVEGLNEDVTGDLESAAQKVPDRNAELFAGFGEAQESVAAVATVLAGCAGADFPPGDVAADVFLGIVGVERDFRPIQEPEQLRFVGMQPRQQAVESGEAGAAAEDTVELGGVAKGSARFARGTATQGRKATDRRWLGLAR